MLAAGGRVSGSASSVASRRGGRRSTTTRRRGFSCRPAIPGSVGGCRSARPPDAGGSAAGRRSCMSRSRRRCGTSCAAGRLDPDPPRPARSMKPCGPAPAVKGVACPTGRRAPSGPPADADRGAGCPALDGRQRSATLTGTGRGEGTCADVARAVRMRAAVAGGSPAGAARLARPATTAQERRGGRIGARGGPRGSAGRDGRDSGAGRC